MSQIFKAFFYLLPRILSDKNLLVFFTYKKLFFYSFLYHRFKRNSSDEEKTLKILGYKICFFSYPILINQFEEIFIYKSYQFGTEEREPLIFDCGSNIGISIIFFKIFHPGSIIIAFEPDPENFRLLKKNIEENKFEQVTIHNLALGKEDGIAKLYNSGPQKGSQNSSIYSDDKNAGFINIPMKRLSSFISQKINFMKIDVEGAEGEIIREIIDSDRVINITEIVIEYHQRSVLTEPELTSVLKNEGLLLEERKQRNIHSDESILRFKRSK